MSTKSGRLFILKWQAAWEYFNLSDAAMEYEKGIYSYVN